MKPVILLAACLFALTACDEVRQYEKNTDFRQRYWLASEKPSFDFEIQDSTQGYTLSMNIRNESSYANSNIYFMYTLQDESGAELERKLVSEFLFDKKTGRPFGSSGLGDIFTHRFVLLNDYRFPGSGKYSMTYEQFMRTDTLRGILSVGLRVDRANP